MKIKKEVIGFVLLMICSVAYDFQMPEKTKDSFKTQSFVILEGEFLKNGRYEFEGRKQVQDIVNEVGISDKANLQALSLDLYVQDESRLYLPAKKDRCVSLNHASQEELMTLKGIGEKTSLKIIEYRESQSFEKIEDIMNITGIGEKTYLRLRDSLCL